jgi:hypothetical protein
MTINAAEFLIGVYNVYLNPTVPADGEGLEMVAGVPVGGTLIGITDGDLGLKFTPSIVEIKGVQGNGILNIFQSDEEAEISFSLKQIQDFTLLNRVLMGASPFTDVALTPNQSLIGVGGLNEIPATKRIPWAFVARMPYLDDDYYFYILFFEAFASSGLDLSINKEKESVVPVTLKPVTQLDRTAGQQIFIIGKEVVTP